MYECSQTSDSTGEYPAWAGENHRVHDVHTLYRGNLYWGRAHETWTDGFNARRLVPDSDSRDCFWLLVPHSSMAASTVTDPSSQGATTRHAARRRGSDTRHDDASLLGSHRLILGGWDQEGGVDACAEVVAPSVTSQRTRRTRTAAPRRGTGHAGAPVRHGERA